MDLIIDIGNTQVKVALFRGDQISKKIYCLETDLSTKLESILAEVDSVLLSTVKPFEEMQFNYIKKKVSVFHVLSSNSPLPFKMAYRNPKTVGADRLALAAAAVQSFPDKAALVIDMGTCITYDFISSDKQYKGGAISPGLRMRFKALNEFTGKLPLLEYRDPKDLVGDTTEESILSGVINGIIKEVDGIIDDYKMRYPHTKIILTGGDALLFDKKLKNSIFADADFLLKGMHFILKNYALKKI